MSVIEQNLPEAKKTVLGLYVTAQEAYAKWQAAPEEAIILDARTPEEYLFVGHPTRQRLEKFGLPLDEKAEP